MAVHLLVYTVQYEQMKAQRYCFNVGHLGFPVGPVRLFHSSVGSH